MLARFVDRVQLCQARLDRAIGQMLIKGSHDPEGGDRLTTEGARALNEAVRTLCAEVSRESFIQGCCCYGANPTEAAAKFEVARDAAVAMGEAR